MAVTRNLFAYRQRNPLVDELLKQAAIDAQQSISTPASQYAAEAYGGNFPIGSLTSSILKGITAQSNIERAKNVAGRDTRLADILKQSEVTGKLTDDKFFDETTGDVMQMTGGPAEGSIVDNQIKVTPQAEASSLTIGDDPSFIDKLVKGAIDETKITNKQDLMADLNISQDELDIYKSQKQGKLTPTTFYKGQVPVTLMVRTDAAGNFVGVETIDRKPVKDLSGFGLDKATITARQKFIQDFATDFITKANVAGREYNLTDIVTQANNLADKIGLPVDQIATDSVSAANIMDTLKNAEDGDITDSLDIITGDDNQLRTSTQADDGDTITPTLSEKEKSDIESKKQSTEKTRVENIKNISGDVAALDTTKSKISALESALPEIERLYTELNAMGVGGAGITAMAAFNKSGLAAQLIGLLDSLKGTVFVTATGKLKEAGGGSTGMGQLTEVEGQQIRDSEGQVKVELKDQTIKTLKKLLDDLKKGEGRKLKLLKQLYGEEYKKFMAN